MLFKTELIKDNTILFNPKTFTAIRQQFNATNSVLKKLYVPTICKGQQRCLRRVGAESQPLSGRGIYDLIIHECLNQCI